MPSRKWRLLVFVLAFVCEVPHLSAVVVEGRLYHGQQVECAHGGAWIGQTQLGVYSRARLYEQVFAGTVQSAVDISFTDKRLRIIPDEMFVGNASGEITATVNQACLPENLPEIKARDKWVFYVRTKKYLYPDAKPPYITTDGLMVVFDSPTKPVRQAEYDICLLRLHSDLDESCIAEKPTPPRDTNMFCTFQATFPFSNPFPQPIPFQEPSKSTFQRDGINLKRIIASPEFRAPDSRGLNAGGFNLQTRRWLPSYSADADEWGKSD